MKHRTITAVIWNLSASFHQNPTRWRYERISRTFKQLMESSDDDEWWALHGAKIALHVSWHARTKKHCR